MHSFPGTFTVIDGLDLVGKGVVIDAIVDDLRAQGYRVLDLHAVWEKERRHPQWTQERAGTGLDIPLESFDVLVSAEPTFAGIGWVIRQEITAKNGRQYSAHATADAYALDRLTLYHRVVLPALAAGKHVVQSRSVSTSIVYQPMQRLLPGEDPLTIEEVLAIEGNAFALEHAPNHLIIPSVGDIDVLMARLDDRAEKRDDCIFEDPDFLRRVNPLYKGDLLRGIFESRGTGVYYLDASVSVKHSQNEAVRIYRGALPQLFA